MGNTTIYFLPNIMMALLAFLLGSVHFCRCISGSQSERGCWIWNL